MSTNIYTLSEDLIQEQTFHLDDSEWELVEGIDFVSHTQSELMQGSNNPFFGLKHSEKTKKHLSEKFKGRSPWNTGKKLSDEHKAKVSKSCKGRIVNEESKKKLSAALKGRELSDDWKEKLSVAAKNRLKVKCPHCDKEGDTPNMKRWHFDNCKIKNL